MTTREEEDAMRGGRGFEPRVRRYLDGLSCVSRVFNFGIEDYIDSKPDYGVVLTDGTRVLVEVKWDSRGLGNCTVPHQHVGGYRSWGEINHAQVLIASGPDRSWDMDIYAFPLAELYSRSRMGETPEALNHCYGFIAAYKPHTLESTLHQIIERNKVGVS